MLAGIVVLHGNSQQREETIMRYTKPNVLSTVNANLAIQAGSNPQTKSNPTVVDSVQIMSTSAGYPADE
jgi:hypothetical protein